ncbi:hypothetical protein OS493_003735 [Desmophyllum pertusum]|uniref:Polysaccharide lyase family 8 central domain-containing protein n=1 Tax=Desmophyllum pertusum TaxID=174260 RepID=A0A9X0DB51_9CNID|nr:hypothetical protein OS493_003735 [Desmophyllum pertusum]
MRNCKYGEKFGFIMEKLLLPLALEYHLRSRANEVIAAATSQLPELNSGVAKDGKPNKFKGKYYFNSLGSLQIMEAVNSTAASQSISAEQSPEGHWSKNFAALSVHRRKDWAVTVKGFNNFVWDYETSATENVYGLFASHGALLVANSETLLEVHDVEHGWDWAKVPGATTIAMGSSNIDDLNIGSGGRFYNKRKLAGSLTFEGTKSLKNGLFGMNFLQPEYGLASSDWRQNIDFRFKKSVFFFENLLVCLGSDIRAQHTSGRVAQTTLFQDRLKSGVASSYIEVDGVQKNALSNYNHSTAPPSVLNYVTLTDAKRNFYYVPSPNNSALNVTVQNQNSKSDDGTTSTFGHYGTAWLEHSTSNQSYEYAVLIPTTSYHTPLADLVTAQGTAGSEVYKVLQKNATAHVVQFLKSPKLWSALSAPITGYVIFRSTSSLPANGPVEAVTRGDCLIMAEETTQFIHLGISSPDLKFFPTSPTPLENSNDVDEKMLFTSTSRTRSVKVTLRKAVTQSIVTQVHGTPDNYTPTVVISSNGKEIRFTNLKNGFSVEVKLTRI